MKRIKFLILAGVVATAMMSAGYAIWTDSFTIASTVHTGNLVIELLNPSTAVTVAYTDEAEAKGLVASRDNIEKNTPTEHGVDNVDRSVAFTFDKLYPGTVAATRLQAKNSGTIPAAIKDVNVTITDKKGRKITAENATELVKKMNVYYTFVVKDSSGNTRSGSLVSGVCSLLELSAKLSSQLTGQYLLPGEILDAGDASEFEGYSIRYSVPTELEDARELDKFNVKIDFEFVQHNSF